MASSRASCRKMTLLSTQYVLLVLALYSVKLLQWLLSSLLPPASQLLAKVVLCLERRKREELLHRQEAAERSHADEAVARFVGERAWQCSLLRRYGDVGMWFVGGAGCVVTVDWNVFVGSRRSKYWYRVSWEEGREKLLTVVC